MDLGRAKRVTIYLNEWDRIGRRAAHDVIVERVREAGGACPVVHRGIEGYGGSGVVHDVLQVDAAPALPLVVEWVDRPEHIDRLLPLLRQIVPAGLVIVEDTEVVFSAAEGAIGSIEKTR